MRRVFPPTAVLLNSFGSSSADGAGSTWDSFSRGVAKGGGATSGVILRCSLDILWQRGRRVTLFLADFSASTSGFAALSHPADPGLLLLKARLGVCACAVGILAV